MVVVYGLIIPHRLQIVKDTIHKTAPKQSPMKWICFGKGKQRKERDFLTPEGSETILSL